MSAIGRITFPPSHEFAIEPEEPQVINRDPKVPGAFNFRFDDASVDAATSKYDNDWFRRFSGQEINPRELLEVIRTANDFGKITRQEWDQISAWVDRSHLSPAAYQVFREAEAAIASHTTVGAGKGAGVIKGEDLTGLLSYLEGQVRNWEVTTEKDRSRENDGPFGPRRQPVGGVFLG